MEENIVPTTCLVSDEDREFVCGQKPVVLWLTGLSGSGKSSIARKLERVLWTEDHPAVVLDGDDVRKGVNRDLSFSQEDRAENNRRVAEMAKIILDSGSIVLVSLISPTEECRQTAKKIIGEDRFHEIFVDCPVETCVKRDPKGLYEKAALGKINDFTGITSDYSPPEAPSLVVKTEEQSLKESVLQIMGYLSDNNLLIRYLK